MHKLQDCIDKKRINVSRTREVIYKILLESTECLSVTQIIQSASELYPKKISLNTVYRHLKLFSECGLAVVIQDDMKKAYYCIKEDDILFFKICPICNNVKRLDISKLTQCDIFEKSDFITVHKRCKACT